MITIWKLENDSWVLICESNELELDSKLAELRLDGNEYRAELRIESTSSVLEV